MCLFYNLKDTQYWHTLTSPPSPPPAAQSLQIGSKNIFLSHKKMEAYN